MKSGPAIIPDVSNIRRKQAIAKAAAALIFGLALVGVVDAASQPSNVLPEFGSWRAFPVSVFLGSVMIVFGCSLLYVGGQWFESGRWIRFVVAWVAGLGCVLIGANLIWHLM